MRLVVGTTSSPPLHYIVDRNRVQLGQGEGVWNRAVDTVRAWQMFNIPWLRLYWPNSPIRAGTDVAVMLHHFGFWSLNGCRIVYVVEDKTSNRRQYGFAYGTLSDHAVECEERFTVEWNRSDNTVWYDILAFSRPKKLLAMLAYPLSHSLQRRFASASKAAMLAAVCPLSTVRRQNPMSHHFVPPDATIAPIELAHGNVSDPAVSPDRKIVAYIRIDGQGRKRSRSSWCRNWGAARPHLCAQYDGLTQNVFMQPLAGGEPQQLIPIDSEPGIVAAYAWSRDGKKFAITRARYSDADVVMFSGFR